MKVLVFQTDKIRVRSQKSFSYYFHYPLIRDSISLNFFFTATFMFTVDRPNLYEQFQVSCTNALEGSMHLSASLALNVAQEAAARKTRYRKWRYATEMLGDDDPDAI
jgi:hypothetical protein